MSIYSWCSQITLTWTASSQTAAVLCVFLKCGMLCLLCKCFLGYEVEVSTDGSNFIFGCKNVHSQVEGTVILPGMGGYFWGSNAKLALLLWLHSVLFFLPPGLPQSRAVYRETPYVRCTFHNWTVLVIKKKSLKILKLPYFNQQCNPVITDKGTNLISCLKWLELRLLCNPEPWLKCRTKVTWWQLSKLHPLITAVRCSWKEKAG